MQKPCRVRRIGRSRAGHLPGLRVPGDLCQETCAERISLALALGLAASRLEEQPDDPKVVAVAKELARLSGLMRDRLRASRPDDPDNAGDSAR